MNMASEGEPRKLSELRVVDLKAELEKRSIDQTGVKAVLVKKLQKALTDEGQDPETFVFYTHDKGATPKKMKKEDDEISLGENEKEGVTGVETDKIEEEKKRESESDSVVSFSVDGINLSLDDSQVKEGDAKESKEPLTEIKEGKIYGNDIKEEPAEVSIKEEVIDDKTEEENNEKEMNESMDVPLKFEDEEEKLPDSNGLDAEDSINLTIGEDEKIIADEDETCLEKDMKEREASRGAGKISSESGSRKGEKRNSSPDKSSDDKGKKQSDYRNLWVSGLSSATRATDLKHVFSKQGKVVAAKVVTNAKTPGARCYGFVTMATSEDAMKCIKGLNRTELHGRLISVEAAKRDSSGHLKKPQSSQVANKPSSAKKDGKRKGDSPNPDDKKKRRGDSENLVPPGTEDMVEEIVDEAKKKEESSSIADRGRDRERRADRGRERTRSGDNSTKGSSRGRSRDHSRSNKSPGVLSFSQIKEERERQRLREKERALREEERRRREERDRQREVERRQREEAARLEREREKIRIERERLERERAELLKMERDRLEREKEDLKRQQLKLEEARRGKRTLSSSRDSYEERKRASAEGRRYEAAHRTSPPRFEAHRSSSDYKKVVREAGMEPAVSHSRFEDVARSRREESSRAAKEGHYPERARAAAANPSYRGREDRERRGEEGSHRTKTEATRMSHHARERFETSSKGDSWSSGPISKGFNSVVVGGGREAWGMSGPERKPDLSPWARPPQAERWVTGNSMPGRGGPGMYPPVGNMSGGPSMPLPMSNSAYQGGDRFDAYKPMGSIPRKY